MVAMRAFRFPPVLYLGEHLAVAFFENERLERNRLHSKRRAFRI
jgi:hypothetical protein